MLRAIRFRAGRITPVVGLAMLALSASSSSGRAYYILFGDGNALLKACETLPDYALGYVIGASDLQQATQSHPPEYCIPKKAKSGQLRDVFCKYLKDNPEQRHENASLLMKDAFAKAWPC